MLLLFRLFPYLIYACAGKSADDSDRDRIQNIVCREIRHGKHPDNAKNASAHAGNHRNRFIPDLRYALYPRPIKYVITTIAKTVPICVTSIFLIPPLLPYFPMYFEAPFFYVFLRYPLNVVDTVPPLPSVLSPYIPQRR